MNIITKTLIVVWNVGLSQTICTIRGTIIFKTILTILTITLIYTNSISTIIQKITASTIIAYLFIWATLNK